ncbi:olfactory receptor 4Q3-like [Hemicordylus capensis]|uniref:olfactory receptor 4Q3-like n=1 Tax=Hemicordylus capensis TaxID=884348 RepID=UPI002303840F|nr:olfactory receptor 4Q3-like [Hemicordylus capensis]
MNGSTISEFILLGFSCPRSAQPFLFTFVLVCYTTILLGNFLIMVTVLSEPRLLQSPMYFFLVNLSLLDMSMGSVGTPKLMADLLNNGSTISYGGCMAQLYFLHVFGGAEMLLLTLMAYDRYLAICQPLRYTTIMDRKHCFRLLTVCWAGGLIHGTFQILTIAQLPFCGPNVLDNFFCDIPQVIKLACSDIYVTNMLMVINSILLTLPCFLSILVSYVIILATLCSRFGKGSGKAFSTCGSHLMVVSLFYLPIVYVYLKLSSSTQLDKMVSVFYMVLTPALSPLIYTLRNQEMKGTIGKLKCKCKLLLLSQREYMCEISFPYQRLCCVYDT